jgi:hypothetical protein
MASYKLNNILFWINHLGGNSFTKQKCVTTPPPKMLRHTMPSFKLGLKSSITFHIKFSIYTSVNIHGTL